MLVDAHVPRRNSTTLGELAALFLRLGTTAFGGPAVHIAMMRDEVVERRRWMRDAEFLDLLAATHLIPGPNSTELAIHLGYKRCGLSGLLVAGGCFILPACLIVMGLAWVYTRYGQTPEVTWLMYGIGPVVIAIVGQAMWKLGRSAFTGTEPVIISVAAAAGSLAGVHELIILAAGGAGALAARWGAGAATVAWAAGGAGSATIFAAIQTLSDPAVPITLTRLALFFLRVGSVLFGSGYVLLAFLRADLTERWGWLTEQQLIDAVTVGQITPGPVFTTATFIGYLLGGWAGALLSTAAIFAPGFFFVAVSQPFIASLRASRIASALLDGVVASSLGLMAAVTWHLGRTVVVDLPTAAVLAASIVVLLVWQPSSSWLIAGGALAGWWLHGG